MVVFMALLKVVFMALFMVVLRVAFMLLLFLNTSHAHTHIVSWPLPLFPTLIFYS